MTDSAQRTRMARRTLLGGTAALGVGAAGLSAAPAAADSKRPSLPRGSSRAALKFLQRVVDAYRDSGPRLAQSYQDASGLADTAFVYDNALALIALLSSGDTRRARAIGDALIYAQDHDESFTDGRVRQAYHADGFTYPNGIAHFAWEFGLVGTAVGDMSWSGIALAHLSRRTGLAAYAKAAVRIADWIQKNTYSTSGLGGYTFGATDGLEQHKSAEHNIDVYAFFRMIATITGDRAWLARADHAWEFVEQLWNAEQSYFWTGSNDGSTVNRSAAQLPLDVQTWSWLAARRERYAGALDWAAVNLATTDTPVRLNSRLPAGIKISGVGFASGSLTADPTKKIDQWNPEPDSGAVWFEGTAQLALALRNRSRWSDGAAAEELLDAVVTAQQRLGRGQTFNGTALDGGIVAASSPMNTGFGFGYYPNLHVGATSWYLFAANRFNPYRLDR